MDFGCSWMTIEEFHKNSHLQKEPVLLKNFTKIDICKKKWNSLWYFVIMVNVSTDLNEENGTCSSNPYL